jgi:hypothetical protein
MTFDWMLTRESSRGRRPPLGAGAGPSCDTGSVNCSDANRLPFADAPQKTQITQQTIAYTQGTWRLGEKSLHMDELRTRAVIEFDGD